MTLSMFIRKTLLFIILFQLTLFDGSIGFHYYEPALNFIEAGEDNFVCPWYRNLARHVPMPSSTCGETSVTYRKFKNCLSDKDCASESFCCLAICQGITRCYNPYINEFTDNIPSNNTKKPCPIIVEPPKCAPAPTTTETTTTIPTTTTKKTTTTKPTTTTTEPTTTTTTTKKPTTTTTTKKPTTTTTPEPEEIVYEDEMPTHPTINVENIEFTAEEGAR